MAQFLIILITFALVVAAIVTLITLLAIRTARGATRGVRRARSRLAESLPASAFGNHVWWQATRLDRVGERVLFAVRSSSGSAFTNDICELAARLDTGTTDLRANLRSISTLPAQARNHEIARIEPHITELESGAEALAVLSTRSIEVSRRDDNEVPVGELVRRRAEALTNAIDELAELGPTSAMGSVVDTDDAQPRPGLVAGIEPDEQRRHRFDGRSVVQSPGVDRA